MSPFARAPYGLAPSRPSPCPYPFVAGHVCLPKHPECSRRQASAQRASEESQWGRGSNNTKVVNPTQDMLFTCGLDSHACCPLSRDPQRNHTSADTVVSIITFRSFEGLHTEIQVQTLTSRLLLQDVLIYCTVPECSSSVQHEAVTSLSNRPALRVSASQVSCISISTVRHARTTKLWCIRPVPALFKKDWRPGRFHDVQLSRKARMDIPRDDCFASDIQVLHIEHIRYLPRPVPNASIMKYKPA